MISAASVAMALLRAGASSLDAVEMAVKLLEDREITNAGYGSNLAFDGTVECDATIMDEHGRSGAVGAVCRGSTSPCLSMPFLELTCPRYSESDFIGACGSSAGLPALEPSTDPS